ncbi:DMT family transporter [Streptomyces sp. NPDC058955]|uniref:DMT family transporter n=1 Tax=unclassified Streptomyces TaxID=2593676 RepID=UPI0036554098
MKDGRHGSLARVAALALLWGSAFLWIKLALNSGLTPFQIAFLRSALGATVLLALSRGAHERLPRDRGTWRRLVVAAFFCNALPFLLFGIAEQNVDSGLAGVLHATTPLWSVLIGALIGTERHIPPVRWGGLLLGFAGTLMIFAPWQATGLLSSSALALLAASASYAVGFAYMGSKLTGRASAPLSLAAAQLVVATALTAPGALSSDTASVDLDLRAILAVLALGILSTGFTFYLSYRLIADEGATSAATVGYLLPVVSVALGAIVLDEKIGLRVLAGAAVVLAGVAATRWHTRPASPADTATRSPEPLGPAEPAEPTGQGGPDGSASPASPASRGGGH